MHKTTDHTGVFSHVQWRSPDAESDFIIGVLEDETTVLGDAPDGSLVRGLEYQFQGYWDDHPAYGKQFKFQGFVQNEPLSPDAVVTYLVRYSPPGCGVGPATARRIVDRFGKDALSTIRSDPAAISQACPRIQHHQALKLAEVFRKLADMEATKVRLMQLFAGRGFPKLLVDESIQKWGIQAYVTIKENPFVLLIERMTGCGFARVDRLYIDLGHKPAAMVRQMFCCWHIVKADMSGSTWLPVSLVADELGRKISGTSVNPRAAIEQGVEEGWLATKQDGEGKRWIADGRRAKNEETLAVYLR